MTTQQVRLVDGPYDGLVLDQVHTGGAWMIVDGDTRRAAYDPDPDDPTVWHYQGMIEDV